MSIELSGKLLFSACQALGEQLIQSHNETPGARPLAAYALVVFDHNGVQEVRIASVTTKPCTVDLDALRASLATIPAPVPEG